MKRRLLLYVLLLTLSLAAAFAVYQNFLTTTRGVSHVAPDAPSPPMQFGVNADLDQYNATDLSRALEMIHAAKLTVVRQHFYWQDIEPRRGEYDWDKWDRIVASAMQNDLDLVAVLDTTPVWARDPGEADLPNAAPKNPDDYAQFVAAFTRHYSTLRYIQVWDNPNVHPFWGRRIVDPKQYTELLRAAATAARAANPNVVIISAGLAPNGELVRGHADYSDVLFLRGMYDAGARDYFDILGVKPYGMWSGPDDRRADKDVFNFSRVIVLRDEMVAHGDANKPVWAVEFGWNALPADWRGASSPWGSDTEEKQSVRLYDAVLRAKSEWQPWMGAMIVQTFQPNAPGDDPVWGFALVDKNFQPGAAFSALTRSIASPAQPASFDLARFYLTLVGLLVLAAFSAWRATLAARQIAWWDYWRVVRSRFDEFPQITQYAIVIIPVIAFYISRNWVLNFALLTLIVLLFALRLDLGLAITVFTIPFYLQTKNLIGSAEFSLVELLTWSCVAAWAVNRVSGLSSFRVTKFKSALESEILKFTPLDRSIIFFVLAGLVSVKIAANFGVANREFRVIILEPALMYALVRSSDLAIEKLRRLLDALILSALAISLLGLYQFLFTNYVIIGEGVRRILSVYGSPNNLALYLDRMLPMLIALAIFDDSKQRRIAYAIIAVPIALCLYWTFSRAALLFALPAGLAMVAFAGARRARIALGALFLVGLLALIPFTQTARWQSLFQEGTGTGFFRVSVWQSAWEMGWQHPFFGVGLDNFLYEYPKYIKPDAWREPNLSHPHDIILDFWTRLGIPGLIALTWMVAAFFRAGLAALTSRASSQNAIAKSAADTQLLRQRATLSRGGAEAPRAIVIALMAGMIAALVHGMIDAAYFFVDLAFVWMLMLGLMAQLARTRLKI